MNVGCIGGGATVVAALLERCGFTVAWPSWWGAQQLKQLVYDATPDLKILHLLKRHSRQSGVFMGRQAIKREMDQHILIEWIADRSRVLDLGCGRGVLLQELMTSKHCYTVGIDSDLSKITSCVKRGVPAYQGDLMDLLPVYDDQNFDWVVCSRTLQELNNPREILHEALRVGKRLAIGFVNHGFWINRREMLLSGSRVQNEVYPQPWWSSRAMNPVSISGFEAFCQAENVIIERRMFLSSNWRTPCHFLPSWFAGYAVYELRRGAVG